MITALSILYMYIVIAIFVAFAVGGGAVTVNKDSTVQILAEEAQPIERFDKQVSIVTSVQNSRPFLTL